MIQSGDIDVLLISEIFSSIQGEGFWTGTPCTFVRLHGCPVGCWFCDEKHNSPQRLSVDEIVKKVDRPKIVITGGEPLTQDISELLFALQQQDKGISIETSGIRWNDALSVVGPWITLSPKEHLNPQLPVDDRIWASADEVKLVISTGDEVDFYQDRLTGARRVFLQPEWNDRDRTIPLVLKILESNPIWRLSVQTHKYLGVA